MQPMSMAPFGARPVTAGSEQRRARLAALIATLGIAATVLAYVVSPGVRHAVSHAAHSVKHAVGNVLDRDAAKRVHKSKAPAAAKPKTRAHPSGAGASSRVTGGFTISSAQTSTPVR
jgi:hypothetical protein